VNLLPEKEFVVVNLFLFLFEQKLQMFRIGSSDSLQDFADSIHQLTT